MRGHRPITGTANVVTVLLAACSAGLALGCAPAHAQSPAPAWSTEAAPGWLGIGYEVRWTLSGDQCTPVVLVRQVVQGSPAERAGLRAGDALVTIDGEPAPTRLASLPSRLEPGDTVHVRLERDGRPRELAPVADRRPARPPRLAGEGFGLFASSAPVVWTTGDTIVARNLDKAGMQGLPGYWLARSDGETEYRSLHGLPGDPLDRQVQALVECAGRATAPSPPAPELRRVLPRADSLRLVFARRAMEQEREQDVEVLLRRLQDLAPDVPSATPPAAAPPPPQAPGAYVFRFETPMATGRRAVAGAELTELEPELAEYFRNARDGLLVLRVADGTPAQRAGLRPGDVIVRGAGRRTRTIEELRAVVVRPQAVEIEIIRKGRSRTLTLGGR